MSTSKSLPKILMLHGYTQNAAIFSKRIAAVRKVCRPYCEMVPAPGTGAFDKYDSMASSMVSSETDPELIPRGWWTSKDLAQTGPPTKVYQGLDETLVSLRQVIDAQGPFDACFGFSQGDSLTRSTAHESVASLLTHIAKQIALAIKGAALAAVLGSILENPTMHEAFSSLKEKPDGQKAFKAVILIAGYKLDLPTDWYGDRSDYDIKKLKTRSLHVLGRTDTIVREDHSAPLALSFSNPRVEWHDGGHFVPSKKNWRDMFAKYIQTLDHPDEAAIPSPRTLNHRNVLSSLQPKM